MTNTADTSDTSNDDAEALADAEAQLLLTLSDFEQEVVQRFYAEVDEAARRIEEDPESNPPTPVADFLAQILPEEEVTTIRAIASVLRQHLPSDEDLADLADVALRLAARRLRAAGEVVAAFVETNAELLATVDALLEEHGEVSALIIERHADDDNDGVWAEDDVVIPDDGSPVLAIRFTDELFDNGEWWTDQGFDVIEAAADPEGVAAHLVESALRRLQANRDRVAAELEAADLLVEDGEDD